MHEALFWKKEKREGVEGIVCDLCARKCFIPEGKTGFCAVRKNEGGKLYTLTYGKIVALHTDPIEKKPLFHFYPGSTALSYSTFGCNWRCKYCCNWDISQRYGEGEVEEVEPEKVVEAAERNGCEIISHTYTEPTIFFEFALDVARISNEKGMKNTFVTNGYMEEEPLRKISKYLDAVTVDFKASGNEEFLRKYASVPSVTPIFNFIEKAKKLGIHVEVTDLIVPGIGDDLESFKKLVEWLVKLDDEIPFHVLRFFPNFEMMDIPPTPISTIQKFVKIAKEMGLRYVYGGNVADPKLESTFCPKCGEMLIERYGFFVRKKIEKPFCPKCKEKINIVLGE